MRSLIDRSARELIESPVDELGEGLAHLLNWASGPTGPSAQSGLWLNQPITLEHRKGAVSLRHVNERVVELPYALQASESLPAGARVADVGAVESPLSFSLASLGFDVTALDIRAYPFSHPRLTEVVVPVEAWEGPPDPFDAIFCISTLEHVGLGAYGAEPSKERIDKEVMEKFRSWLKVSGFLILTVPYGKWSVTRFERTYDSEHLEELLSGWVVVDKRIMARTGHSVWQDVAAGNARDEMWTEGSGVALVRARVEA